MPPGVDLEIFGPGDHATAKHALGGGRIVLFVGRLQPLKGPDTAIRALAALDALLPDDGLPTRLVIVGGASGNGRGVSDPARLRALATQLGVADRVAFLAPRPPHELAPLYRAADVVLVPSHSQRFGLVALEAQAADAGSWPAGRRAALRRPPGRRDPGRKPRPGRVRPRLAALPHRRPRPRRRGSGRASHAAELTWDATTQATLDVYARVLAGDDVTAAVAQGA